MFVRALLGAEENKDLLISFINAVFSEKGFNLVVSLDVLNPYNLTEYLKDKETVLDIKAKDNKGRTINIEVQVADHNPSSPKLLEK